MKKIVFLISGLGVILFCFLFGFQKEQKLQKPLEYEVRVELVVVEVFVTDNKGNFVDNLRKDDFEIFEDGKKVDIAYFAVAKPEKEAEERIREEIPEKRKAFPPQKMKLVILFDTINTNRFYLDAQWPRFNEMFQALSEKVEETMIIELSRGAGVRVLQPFTSDQQLLSQTLSQFMGDFWKEVEKQIRKVQVEELERELRLRIQDRFISDPKLFLEALSEEETNRSRGRLEDSFSSFLAAVNHIRKFEGIKAILIVSDGLRLENGFVKIFDPFKLFGGKKYFDQMEAFEKLLQIINEERIIFYAFSPKGIKPDFTAMAGSIQVGEMFRKELDQWSKELYSIEKIAEETGGLYLSGQKKYEEFVKELGRDLTHYYDISYKPPKREGKGGYHKIEVRVKRPDLRIRYKKGYSDFTPEEREKKNIATAFLSPSFYKDIDFSCRTDFIALDENFGQFWIRVAIPLDQFREPEDKYLQEKISLLFGINEPGEYRVHFGETQLGIKEAIEKGTNILYRGLATSRIKLKPGEYEARVILKQAGDRTSGWGDSLKIPDLKTDKVSYLINSIFGLLVEGEEKGAARFTISPKDSSLLLSHHKFYPGLENVFRKKGNVGLFLQVRNPQNIQDFSFQFSLRAEEKAALSLLSEKIDSLFDRNSKILSEVYLLDFQDVPSGDYQLWIKSSDGQIEKGVAIKIIP